MSAVTSARPATAQPQRRFSRRTRNVILTVHIVASVGLLGDSAGFLAVAIRRAQSKDPAFVEASHDLLGTFALFFGIPLSFLTLLTGIALGLGTQWGVLRYPWVIIKLVLIVTVIVVGATILRPVLADDGDPAPTRSSPVPPTTSPPSPPPRGSPCSNRDERAGEPDRPAAA